ncbi:MAG: DUF3619 family protein [Burkholderiaceae bacterium]|nr:DUF3619 family protein [Burkholderiaceae bacterium]
MNEQQIARLAREALDESIEHLPWRVTHRLASGREAALARMPKRPETAVVASSAEGGHPVLVPATPGHPRFAGGGGGPDGWRRLAAGIAAVLIPALIVALGLLGIAEWNDWQRADDIADLEAAVLTDEVPVAAYADRGFGVYLRNVSEGERR